MRSAVRNIVAVALVGVLALPAIAAKTTLVVKFKPGESSATVAGSIQGYDMTTYLLGAKAGQTVSVRFEPDNTSCAFNLTAPGASEAMFNGSINGTEFTGELPVDGSYSAMAYLMRNAARRGETCNFKLTFAISG
ncbi:MAG: hypothetical protein AB7P20_27315 [Rhizobiaceae bacterium]